MIAPGGTMAAVLFDRYGPPRELYAGRAPIPEAGAGEILIDVEAIGVNPADAKWRAGMFAAHVPLRFPHIPGYDLAGTVVHGTQDLPAGTRIAAILDAHRHGAYAEWAVAGLCNVAAIPDSLSFEAAAALPTPGLTGSQLIEEHLDVQEGQLVLVTGATGSVGRFAVAAACKRGARVVAAVRPRYREAALAQKGVTAILDLGEQDWHGDAFDCVADTVGGAAVAQLCRHVRKNGLIRTVSTTPIPPDDLPAQPVFFAVRPDGPRLARLARAVAQGDVSLPDTDILPLAAAGAAHSAMEEGRAARKFVLIP